jgi:hypothetical protein
MKKLISCCIVALLSVAMFAQKDVTTFLGIPVDGSKTEMKKKLIEKGFAETQDEYSKYLSGEFNGAYVSIYIGTNKNKVYRITVRQLIGRSEKSTIERYNTLVGQFMKNKRYIALKDYTIPKDEYVFLSSKEERYEAVYYQVPDITKFNAATLAKIKEELKGKYTPEQISNPTEEIKKEMIDVATKNDAEMLSMKPVYMYISRGEYDRYYINISYVNEYNRAHGEDL